MDLDLDGGIADGDGEGRGGDGMGNGREWREEVKGEREKSQSDYRPILGLCSAVKRQSSLISS